MDPAAISTTLAAMVDSFECIKKNLIQAEINVVSESHKDTLDDFFLAADDLGDEIIFVFTTCVFNQEALKSVDISAETGRVVTGFINALTGVVESVGELSQVLSDVHDDNDDLSAVIDEYTSELVEFVERMKYVVKAMNVILCLFQVWIDVAYKTNDSILGLSLAVLQEYITTVNKATSGEAGPNAGVTIGLLATAAQSVYSSISSTHPGAAQIAAQTTTTEITSAGRSSFHVKLVVGDYKGVEEFLDCGIHPMAPGPLGVHPLATAVLSGAMDVIKLLVERGADVCAKSGVNGETALLCAAVAGYLDVVEFLIDKGAEVDAVSDRHNTTALLGACDQGHLDVVRFLLVDKKADLSIVDKDGFSPLMKAVAGGHEEIVELLRANGAEEILTNDGLLPSPSQVTVIARVMTGGGAIRLVVEQPGRRRLSWFQS